MTQVAMTQLNLLSRLHGIDLHLLAPRQADSRPISARVDPAAYHTLIHGVRRLREQADGHSSIWQALPDDARDTRSWHIIGVESATAEVVGALRLRVYDLTAAPLPVQDLFAFSEIEIGDRATHAAIQRALAAYGAEQAARCGRFYQIGGFAVAAPLRGSALAPVLGLAVNAWVDFLGLFGGCTFATVNHHVAVLDQRFGAFPLTYGGAELPPFYCDHHHATGRILATEPLRFEPRLAGTVAALIEWIGGAAAVVPE